MTGFVAGVSDTAAIEDALEQIAQFGLPSRESAHITDVGTDRFIAFFETEILDEFIAFGGATCRFYEAVYGAGKTHLLDLLATMGLERGMAVCRIDLSQALDLEEWHRVTKHILEHVTLRIAGQDSRSLPLVMEMLGRFRSGEPHRNSGSYRHAGFAKALELAFLSAYGTDRARELVHQYLMGEKVGAGMLRREAIHGVKDPLSARNAEAILETAMNGIHRASGYGVMLLFDESERTLESPRAQPSRAVRTAANLMRRLIDACAAGRVEGAVVVFAVLPGFVERCGLAYQALGQRLRRTGVDPDHPAWRWPLLDVVATNRFEDADEFAEKACVRITELVEACHGDTAGLLVSLREIANSVLQEHAGSDYRRPLMKRLAVLALERIESE